MALKGRIRQCHSPTNLAKRFKGDRVLFHDEPGEIEFVADALIGDPAMDWYVEEHGGGVMVIEPKYFGHAFLTETHIDHLVFVSRADDRKLK